MTKTAIKERPILFNSEMVKAVLDGRKTQTRRVVKPLCGVPDFYDYQPGTPYPYYFRRKDAVWDSFKTMDELAAKYCPYGKTGDRLWVRETWRPYSWGADFDWMMVQFAAGGANKEIDPYEAWQGDRADFVWMQLSDECAKAECPMDGEIFTLQDKDGEFPIKWRPSIFMPRAASRITLEILSIRIERAQEINDADAMAEGVNQDTCPIKSLGSSAATVDWIEGFKILWDSVSKDRGFGWDKNPFVWVVEFKRIEP